MTPPLPQKSDLDDRIRHGVNALAELAVAAGDEIMSYFRGDAIPTEIKSDGSPVSAADLAADRLIQEQLRRLYPEIPVISEESPLPRLKPGSGDLFLVDPLDGTRDFLRGDSGFTVNIAWIADSHPVCGIIYAPALGRLFVAASPIHAWQCRTPFATAHWSPLKARCPDRHCWTLALSRPHPSKKLATLIRSLPQGEPIIIGSSFKLCLIAAAEADLYPRYGQTMHWDTAAGHAILQAAGGHIVALTTNRTLSYRASTDPEAYINPPFIAYGDMAADAPELAELHRAFQQIF